MTTATTPSVAASTGRRGRRSGGTLTVDVHHHYLPPAVCAELRARAGGVRRLIDPLISMFVASELDDVDAHLKVMDAAGVDVAVASYSGVSVYGTGMCQRVNDGMSELQRAYPQRFRGSAHLALHESELACHELDRCTDELGLRAVALPTSALGVHLDDPRLGGMWRRIADLSLPVLLHPPLGSTWAPPEYSFERSCARPIETTMAVVRLVSSVLPQHPGLRILVPHCGGAAPFLRGRIEMFFNGTAEPHSGAPRTRREQRANGLADRFQRSWERLYFDTAGTGGWAPVVKTTAEVVGADRMMFGSDYPLESHSVETYQELLDMLDDTGWPDGVRQRVAGGNAEELFKL